MIPYNSKLQERARSLRRDMTDAERKLWQKLRGKQLSGIQFYRQKILGHYIVDFYAPSLSLVIEVDGGQHFEEQQKDYDKVRDDFLKACGVKVLRFSNFQVLQQIESVLEEVWKVVVLKSPLIPLYKRGKEKNSPSLL